MADFTFVINPTTDDEPDIVAREQDIVAFRVYERLSGMDPALDLEKQDLRKRAPEDDSPESPFGIRGMRHAPPVLNKQETVQPPYYLRILLSPPVIAQIDELSDLLGRSARLTVMDSLGARRHVRGLILRAMNRTGPFGRSNVVELQVYPTLWATAISEKSRVWRDVDSVSVLRQILGEYRDELGETPAVIDQALDGRPPVRECVIQWNESDFAFVSRLLERDGIYYFFTHKEDQVNLHLADMRTPYSEGFVPHRHLALEATLGPGSELFDDHASFLSQHVQTVPRSYRVADYNPATADTVLDYSAPSEGESALEVYDYPGEFASLGTAPAVAGRRHTALTARRSLVAGASRCPFLTAGHAVTLPPFNTDAEEKPFRVVEVVHELARDDSGKPYYRNWFEALDGDTAYAPTQRTPVPAAHGTHNATVVSALPEETVDVDEYSRALVLLRWDPSFSPVRARLGQPWAGGKHGVSVLPRTGDEVLVGFIQGNTERPVILTALHNSTTPKKHDPTQMEEHDLEGQADKGAQRQNRYTTSIHNTQGNAIYFNDTTDQELVKIDAYKDFVLEIGHKVSYTPSSDLSGAIYTININQAGLGYTEPPDINISGGDDNAAADAILDGNGAITAVHVQYGGSGYETGSTSIEVEGAPADTGSITGVTVTTTGRGYLENDGNPQIPIVRVSASDGRTSNIDASLEPTVDQNGNLTAITVVTGGAGYRSSDRIEIDAPNAANGTQAHASIDGVTSSNAVLAVGEIGEAQRIANTGAVGTSTALDDPDNQSGEFVQKKADRGSALIRSYGDLTLYVGKLTDTLDEYPAGDHNDEKTRSNGGDIPQKQRGSLNTYVMGGTTHTVRGRFAFVTHPAKGYLVEAEYKSADYLEDKTISSTLGHAYSASATHGTSTDFGFGAGFSHTEGFDTGLNGGGAYNIGWGVDATSKYTVEVALKASGLEISAPGTKFDSQTVADRAHCLEMDSENPANEAARLAALKPYLIAMGAYSAALMAASFVIKLVSAGFTDFDMWGVSDDKAESQVKQFLRDDMPRISHAMHALGGIGYALHLLMGVTWALWRASRASGSDAVSNQNTKSAATGRTESVGPAQVDATTPINANEMGTQGYVAKVVAMFEGMNKN